MISFGLYQTGRLGEAEAAVERGLGICREQALTRSHGYVSALTWRAGIVAERGELDEARRLDTEAATLADALGDDEAAFFTHLNLAELEFRAGNPSRALEIVEKAVRTFGHKSGAYRTNVDVVNLAAYRIALGDLDGARAAAREVLSMVRRGDDAEQGATIAIQHLATVAALRGDARSGARLLGYVDAWYRREGCNREGTEQRIYEILLAALRERLAEPELERLQAEGGKLSEEAATAEALAVE